MKYIIELLKWLLEKDIRTKNAVCFLFALLLTFVFYISSWQAEWFKDIFENYKVIGVAVLLLFVFLSGFLLASLVYSGVASYFKEKRRVQEAIESEKREKEAIQTTLETLTDWQRKFLLRFVVESRTQIPDHEVGLYRVVWEQEMAVLVKKRIVIEHRTAGVYEIHSDYLGYLKENWNPDSGTLS